MLTMRIRNLVAGTMLLGALVGGSAGMALAQGDTTQGPHSHPAHIHSGDCTDFDPNPVAPLNNIEPRLNDVDDDDDDNANTPQGILTASPVLYSESDEIEFSFYDDVLATSHVIVVHESAENIQNVIACGDIGGVVVDDYLAIALHPLNDSGYTGIAILNADNDGEVDVEVYLAEPAVETEPAATPAA